METERALEMDRPVAWMAVSVALSMVGLIAHNVREFG